MSRLARDFSWHLFAFVLVVAGLSVLAPLTWWHARPPRKAIPLAGRRDPRQRLERNSLLDSLPLDHFRGDRTPWPALQPLVAPLGPLVADQIDLDPSVMEIPALPIARPNSSADPLQTEATGELRLSATLARPTQPIVPNSLPIEPLRQPAESLADQPDSPPQSAFPPTKAWPYPSGLVEQLNVLGATTPVAAAWSDQVQLEIERLVQADSLADAAVANELSRLRRLADDAKQLARSISEDQGRSRILRAGYAVVRRLVIWDQVHALAASGDLTAAPVADSHACIAALDKLDSLLHATGAAANWRKHLQLDRARRDFDSPSCSAAEQRQLARDILHRLHSTQLSRAQDKFLSLPPFVALGEQLQARAAQTPDLVGLLTAIERYEHDRTSISARALATEYDLVRWSPSDGVRELAETVNAYYRNANIRVALSSELVNRMIPQQTPQVETVDDTILGAWVSGQSQTNTKLRVALVPDEHYWNIGLEAIGEVASNTASSKGPATFYQDGWSMFRARKKMIVDHHGIRLYSAEAQANANTDLNNVETDFDGIPLLSGLVRAVARNQYDSSQPAAKAEVEDKIVGRATSQLDREVAQKIEQGRRDFQAKVLRPLRELNLEPTAVDLETTAERLIARFRLASRHDVSAHTPRPQAPSDSMLSVQLHESALNNVLENLHLHGRRVELNELHNEMTSRFTPAKKIETPEDLPENVFVTFADEDPVRVSCQDGRVQLTIRLKELAQAGTRNRWTNFTVHAYYGPSADQLDANLQREGIIELIGDNKPLPIGQRVTLSGIFNRVLSKSRKLYIINKQIGESPQLRDQQVTQFVIHDGWIGVALGPKAPGREAAMHPRPALDRE